MTMYHDGSTSVAILLPTYLRGFPTCKDSAQRLLKEFYKYYWILGMYVILKLYTDSGMVVIA